MNNFDIEKIKELFARIFVIGIQNKINLFSFTKALEKSEFIQKIEKNEYDDYFNHSLESIFFDITGKRIDKDGSYGIYNDAYWCGYSYFLLYKQTKKPFSFIFLKLPLKKLVDMYDVYHEMDFSSLLEQFNKLDKGKTILRALCEERDCSISKLSNETKISKATLSKYNSSDTALYKGSFQYLYKLGNYFDIPLSLFAKAL